MTESSNFQAVNILLASLTHSRFQSGTDNLPSRLQIVRWPNHKRKPFANSTRDTGIAIMP